MSRNATPTLSCPAPSSPLPHDRHRPTRTSPGSRPSDMERPWRRALLFPSRGWRGACFPPLPFRTQTGMYLGQAGRGWTCQGPAGGMGVAMTASFRFLAFLSLAPSSLSPRSRPARADAPASPGPGRGWGWGGVGGGERARPSYLNGHPYSPCKQCSAHPHPQHAHTFPIPRGTLPWRAAGPSTPGREQWNSSRPPRVPGLPSFPVINGGATSQLLLKMLHPRA